MTGSAELEPGQTIATYEIISLIGRGGMGEVYLARDRRLNRKVALKFLPVSYMDDEDRLRRFRHEASVASGLNHPNILTVHEIGEDEARRFIVTEFVDGETLRQRLGRGPLEISEALKITKQIASALSAAHFEGVIHRDIKPDNLMLRRDGIVKVLDFGLAKFCGAKDCLPDDATRPLLRTSPGLVMGTLNYMSPEQARGLPLDTCTDLWSLGVVLYEMLTGRLPFSGATSSDVIVSLLEHEPLPLTDLERSELRRVQPIVTRALTKNPENRYQTAHEILDDIQRTKDEFDGPSVRDAETIVTPAVFPANKEEKFKTASAKETGVEGLVGRFFKSRFAPVMGLGLLVFAVVGLYGIRGFRSSPKPNVPIDSLAVLPLVNASGDSEKEYLSDGITESLINSLADLNLKVMSRNTVFRFKSKDINAQAVAKQLGVKGIVTGNVRQVGDELVVNIEFINASDGSVVLTHQYVRKPSDLMAVQSSIAQDVAAKLRVKLSAADQEHLSKWPTNNPEAYQLFLRGISYANKSTPESLHDAIKLYEQAVAQDPNYALAYAEMAQAYLMLGIYFERPKETMPNAKLYCEKALRLDSSLIDAHITLGMINLMYDWDFEQAQRELVSNDGINPKALETFSCSAHILEATGKAQDAEKELKKALTLDPLSVAINTELGCRSYYAHQFEASVNENREALQLDPSNPVAYWGLARAFDQRGMYQQAIDEIKRFVSTGQEAPPIIVAEEGYAYAAAGRKREALEIVRKLNNMDKQTFVDPYLIATIYVGLGDKEKALSNLESALDIRSAFATSMRSEPKFDSLRAEPRFVSMLQQVGFRN
jgi:serine/threonine protein kinase